MEFHSHNSKEEEKACHCKPSSAVSQSLDEMEFERGIWTAVLYNEEDRVRKFIDMGMVNRRDNSGYSALHYAARKGNLAMCRLLIDNGAEIDCKTRTGQCTPLQRAALAGHKAVVQLLVEKKADLRMQDSDGLTALHRAIQNKHLDVVQYILKMDPTLAEIPDHKQETASQMAMRSGCQEIMNLFSCI